MRKVRTWLQNEISGWKKWEVAWLITACAIIVALSIYWQDTWMGILSATTGAACVICTGKGKLSAYVFGLVNSVLYAIISYQAALYGETMLNALYYVPMQFVGFYTWSRHMNTETNEVIKKNMKWTGRLMMTAFILAGTDFRQDVCGAVVDLGGGRYCFGLYVVPVLFAGAGVHCHPHYVAGVSGQRGYHAGQVGTGGETE